MARDHTVLRRRSGHTTCLTRGASPLGLPDTLSHAPLAPARYVRVARSRARSLAPLLVVLRSLPCSHRASDDDGPTSKTPRLAESTCRRRDSQPGSAAGHPRIGGVFQGTANRARSACGVEDHQGVHPRARARRPGNAAAVADWRPDKARRPSGDGAAAAQTDAAAGCASSCGSFAGIGGGRVPTEERRRVAHMSVFTNPASGASRACGRLCGRGARPPWRSRSARGDA